MFKLTDALIAASPEAVWDARFPEYPEQIDGARCRRRKQRWLEAVARRCTRTVMRHRLRTVREHSVESRSSHR